MSRLFNTLEAIAFPVPKRGICKCVVPEQPVTINLERRIDQYLVRMVSTIHPAFLIMDRITLGAVLFRLVASDNSKAGDSHLIEVANGAPIARCSGTKWISRPNEIFNS